MRYFSHHIKKSVNLRVLQLCGFKFNKTGYKALGQGIEESMVLKRFVIQNCNLAQKAFLHILTEGIMNAKSVEILDF